MIFAEHSDLKGSHAFLSASSYHWVNYDAEKLIRVYRNRQEAVRGTELHNYAAMAIRLKQRQARSPATMCAYINDAIGFMMIPEQVLFYSYNAFGTADAISFRDNILRIHDLKTGVEKAHMIQLKIYAALFCLEYNVRPDKIRIELRIYQNDEIDVLVADPKEINDLMVHIVACDKLIEEQKVVGNV